MSMINYNGKILSSKEPVFTSDNRSFRYGDGIFESIRVIKGNLQLFDLHYARLTSGCQLMKLKLAKEWTIEFFRDTITDLLKENEIIENARIRLTIFRSRGGYYEPTNSKAEFLIEADANKEVGYKLNEEGHVVDIYTDMEKTTSLYSTYKTNNSLIYVLASIHKKEHKLDDCFLINSKNRVIEAIDSNIFLVKGGEISTPPTGEGCVAGVMREYLLKVMDENNITYHQTPITLEDLFTAEEIFLTNSISGVQWVKTYKVKQYELGVAKILSEHLNSHLAK